MTVSMIFQAVAAPDYFTSQFRISQDLVRDAEEACLGAKSIELVQYLGGDIGIRAVIKGE